MHRIHTSLDDFLLLRLNLATMHPFWSRSERACIIRQMHVPVMTTDNSNFHGITYLLRIGR